MRRGWGSAAAGIALSFALLGGSMASGQVSDAALKDRVAQLVERLSGPKVEARAAAEKSLIDLGPRVLPFLPAAGDASRPDLTERLERIRDALRQKEEVTNLGASRVTLKGQGLRLTEVVKALQTQTGNVITDLREQYGAEATNPALDLDIDGKTFFEALDLVAEQAGVTIQPYTGDGSIGLMAGTPMEPGMPPRAKPMVAYNGPYRILFKQIAAARDFQAGTGTANAQFEVAWEPRLRPMLLSLKNEDVKVVDDRGEEVKPQVMEEAGEVALRAADCAAEMNVNLVAPDRAAKTLATLSVKASLSVPSGVKAFRFPSLAAVDAVQKQGDISVTLESTEVDEQVWKVALVIQYPEGGPEFESYRQGLFNNRIWLQKPDGSRFMHNGGFNNTGADAGRISFEYLFVDAPGKPADYQLVYEAPSKVVSIPLEIEFKDVPLP
ncbi:hypothetical protein TA3x_001277 [Tundrisphaera sp. TA3]|uniref:hypothetical protein n=1 Tax=Tundrisphaera sp. TA3 TaxID=3435775 RepID=UPI003EB8DC41